MDLKELDISENPGIRLSFINNGRETIYKVVPGGNVKVLIDESTKAHHLIVDSALELEGFEKYETPSQDPNIGLGNTGAGTPAPETPQIPSTPPQSNGMFHLHILPCIDELADLYIADESLTRKQPNTVEFQMLTDSLTFDEISAKENRLAMCDYTLIGEDGKTYVAMRQKQGAKALQWGGTCGNNHPRFEDDKTGSIGLGKYDCKVFLPKINYLLMMKNTGQCVIKPWVHQPNTEPNENRDIHYAPLGTGQSVSVGISKDLFNGEDHRNAVKINGNG